MLGPSLGARLPTSGKDEVDIVPSAAGPIDVTLLLRSEPETDPDLDGVMLLLSGRGNLSLPRPP